MLKSTLKLAQDYEINALGKVIKSLSALSEVEKIVFFGSRLRGDFVGSSDMDLLVVLTDIEIGSDEASDSLKRAEEFIKKIEEISNKLIERMNKKNMR